MWTAVWRQRATLILILVLAAAVFGGSSAPQEDDCIGARIIKESGLTYYCLLAAHAFTGFNSTQPAASAAPLAFEANLGQADHHFQFLAHGAGATVYLSHGEATLDLRESKSAPKVVRAAFAGGNPRAEAALEGPLAGHVNYFLGNVSAKWITDVPTYERVRYRNVYPGIDVVYYGANGTLEHDVVVQPGADPSVVAMAFHGADELSLDSRGSAIVKAGERKVEWKAPVIYQEVNGRRLAVSGRYRKTGQGELGFEIARYDTSKPLIIDPVVTYSSYQGRFAAEGGMHIAIDGQRNTYVAGFTRDTAYPTTPGAYVPPNGLGNFGNGFITKYNANTSAIVYSTYIGGSLGDAIFGVAVDPNGNAYITGSTESDDYPVTTGALKTKLHSLASDTTLDCVVTKLNAAGNALSYSTYLGGVGDDGCAGIAADAQGNAYVTGATEDSFGFPLGDNAPYRQIRGKCDAFLVKLNPTGTQVVYGTLLGGQDSDSGMAIAIDAQGAAYITGQTTSTTFPVTTGVLQSKLAGVGNQPAARFGDAFVAKLSPDGGTFQYVTYLGGRGEEIGMGIAVDSQGNAYVTGSTTSDNFPTSTGAFQSSYKGSAGNAFFPGGDAFVVKVNPAATALVYSTYLGGAKDDWGVGIAVDNSGKVWVAGATLSSDFPVTSDAFQKTYGGGNPTATFPTGDLWIAPLDAVGASLGYSTFMGGTGDEYATGVVLDSAGNAFLTGVTLSTDFPTTANALQKGYGGTDYKYIPLGDLVLVKVSLAAPPATPPVTVSAVSSAASYAGGGAAPGEIVVLTGTNIGPASLATLNIVGGTKIGSQIGSMQVLFDEQPAPLLYVSATQTSAIVPYAVNGHSSTQLVVVNNGTRSAPLTVPVLAVHPALFSANASGRGQGAILNENSSYNSAANPALKGHIVQLYGTGEGQTSPSGIDGLLALLQYPKPLSPVTVTIGGISADVAYYGAAPQAVAGLLQVNATVPPGVASGDQEVIITIGTSKSQSGLTVAVQ